jgi:hypothetical protein
MSHSRCLLLPVLACTTLLLTGALHYDAAPSTRPAVPTGLDPLDASGTPGGAEYLDAAIRTFAPERVPWMEMTLWQRAKWDNFTYEAQGRYLSAPDHRLRLDLTVRVGSVEGELQMVSDGRALRCSYRCGKDGPATIKDVDLTGKPPPGAPPPTPPAAVVPANPDQILQENGCPGVVPLLRTIRAQLQEPRRKTSRWKGHDVIQVLGKWCPDPVHFAGIPAAYLPQLLPCECRVYLEARTLWPLRIEWWGAPSPQQRHVLLTQVEYRHPVLNQPLSAERSAQEFAVSANRTDQ